ncbi:MAG: SpoIIE family protein phosphatase [Roseburia sp.]
MGSKQMILTLLGSLVCKVGIMGCYPVVPAYFAALYLENVSGFALLGLMYIGMFLFMPLTAMVKYMAALLVIAGAIKLVEWANDGCPSVLAGGLAAITTVILSFAGSLLEWKNQPETGMMLLEGVFVFGAVILLNRGFHAIMQWEWRPPEKEQRECSGQEEKLRGYAESFQGLSQIFLSMSTPKSQYKTTELGQVQNELTGKICASCDSCAICWERDSSPLYGALSQLLTSIWHTGKPAEDSEKLLEQYCKKSRDMVEEAVWVFQRVNLNRAWYHRLLENRQVIAEQLDAMAYIMQDCAREEQLLDGEERRSLAEIRYRAKEHGILIEEMHLIRAVDGHIRLETMLKSRRGGCISVKTFVAAAGHALGRSLRLDSESKSFIAKEPARFVLYEDTNYRSVHGISRMKKDGAQISGDNFSFLERDCGELLMGLSDGMGSGSTACKESEMVLDLVERFLAAGFSVETAIRMMNSAMVMKGEDDLYSTVDLCRINLYDGTARFYKIGAAAAFVKRGDAVECIRSATLPVGAETQVEIATSETVLKNGDFIVMVTDGVLEYLHVPKPEETMQEILESIQTNNPGILAKRVMERVMLFTGGRVQDDMTILAACIWEK